MATTTLNRIVPKLLDLYKSGKYSDLTIQCNDRQWNVHRAILALTSGASDLFPVPLDDETADDQKPTTSLDNETPELVDLMVSYFYRFDFADEELIVEKNGNDGFTFSLSPNPTTAQSEGSMTDDEGDDIVIVDYPKSPAQINSCLLVNVHMYALANRLGIHDLKRMAVHKFMERLKEHGDWPYHRFTEVVAAVLQETTPHDNGLRSAVSQLLAKHAGQILEYEKRSDREEGREKWMKVLGQDKEFIVALWDGAVAMSVGGVYE